MSDLNSWKKLEERSIYDNPWINVEEHTVINPSGNTSIYGKVHFKNMAIGIIPLDEDKNTWIVGQWRYPLNEYSWEIPMGGGPLMNSALDSAKRELKEETGLTAETWREIMRIHTSNSVTDEVGFVFVATDLSEGVSELGETEGDLVIRKLPFSDVVDMVMKSEITDSISIGGVLKAARLIESGEL